MSRRAPRTCCDTHADRCRFGRDHTWAGPFLRGGQWSHPDDVHCSVCDGVCTGNRADV